MPGLEIISEARCFGGTQGVYRHRSEATGTDMELAVFLPPGAKVGETPAVYFLSGLTCTWQNFTTKAGAQRYAAEHGLALVVPDTSPRGLDLPGEHEDHDFGSGAGFYLDAVTPDYANHYRMETYVTQELVAAVEPHFGFDPDRRGIFGHSMGGHGALTLALRHPHLYRSISALAPIVAPSKVPWGEKAFRGYLGDDRERWREHDACALIRSRGCKHPILVDQGSADPFLDSQLRPELLQTACEKAGTPLWLRMQDGYDHSYYFIASFVGDHLAHHAEHLSAASA